MLISIEMKRQGDNNQHIERRNNDDNFEIFKLKVLMDIEEIKGREKHADIDPIYNFIVQADVRNVDKNTSEIS